MINAKEFCCRGDHPVRQLCCKGHLGVLVGLNPWAGRTPWKIPETKASQGETTMNLAGCWRDTGTSSGSAKPGPGGAEAPLPEPSTMSGSDTALPHCEDKQQPSSACLFSWLDLSYLPQKGRSLCLPNEF